jgi:biopolymer transport protein ExbD
LLTITVYKEGYVLRGRRVSLQTLENQMMKLARYSKNVSVIIKCTSDSPHMYLVMLLDICSKAGLKNLSVFSM